VGFCELLLAEDWLGSFLTSGLRVGKNCIVELLIVEFMLLVVPFSVSLSPDSPFGLWNVDCMERISDTFLCLFCLNLVLPFEPSVGVWSGCLFDI